MSPQPAQPAPNHHSIARLRETDPVHALLGASAKVAGLTAAAVLVVAVSCRAFFAPAAREWLGFGFDAPARTLETAFETLSVNASLASLCFIGALVLSQIEQSDRGGTDRFWTLLYRAERAGFDVALGLIYLANVLVVGASLGAYGPGMVQALLPHAPVELCAFSLALAGYALSRRRALEPGLLVGAGLAVATLLALGAALETWGAR